MSEMECLDSTQLTELHTCPVCESESRERVGRVNTIHPWPSSIQFDIWNCGQCCHWYTSPLPNQEYLSRLYTQGSLSVVGEGSVEAASKEFSDVKVKPNPRDLRKFKWIIDDVKHTPIKSYLELGMGNGLLVEHFKSKGVNCFAIEPGGWAKDATQVYQTLNELPLNLRFDAIVATDVLEHLSDPMRDLIALAGKLEINGRIFLTFPNSDSFRARFHKTTWRMVRPIGHLHYFSKKSIQQLLKASNLELLHLHSHDLIDQGIFGSLFNFVRQLLRLRMSRATEAFSQLMLYLPVQSMGLGDQWVLIAKKVR
jgi:SAM-dependent methyltransferase